MAEDSCLFIALNAVICMFLFSSVDNGVMTTPKRRILLFVFTVLCFKKSFFNTNSFSLKIEMRNRSSLVNGSKTVVKVNSGQGNLTSMRDWCSFTKCFYKNHSCIFKCHSPFSKDRVESNYDEQCSSFILS